MMVDELLDQYRALHVARTDYGPGGTRFAARIAELADRQAAARILDFGCGKGGLVRALRGRQVAGFDPAVPAYSQRPQGTFDLLVSTDVLEHIPEGGLDAVFDQMRDFGPRVMFHVVNHAHAVNHLPNGRNCHATVRDSAWWLARLQAAFADFEVVVDKAGSDESAYVLVRRQGAPAGKARRAAIVCPGPSAVAFPGRDGYELVVAVNRAAGLVEADYWCLLDEYTWDLVTPLGQPVLVSSGSEHRKLVRRVPDAGKLEFLPINQIQIDRKAKWHQWSATTALALAYHLGAREIDAYGADWSGQEDFDGKTFPRQNRTPERWERERKVWVALCKRLTGAQVVRVAAQTEGVEVQREIAEAERGLG